MELTVRKLENVYPIYSGEELLIYLPKIKKGGDIHLYSQHFFDDSRKRFRMY